MRFWKHENMGRKGRGSGPGFGQGGMHGGFRGDDRNAMSCTGRPGRGFRQPDMVRDAEPGGFGFGRGDGTGRTGGAQTGLPRRGGRFRRFMGRLFGGVGHPGSGRNASGAGRRFRDGSDLGPGSGFGRGMRSGQGMRNGSGGMGRGGNWSPTDRTPLARPDDSGLQNESGRHGEAWATAPRRAAPATALGTCPLCDNHCPLSNPGCPKGEAYGRSLNAEARR